MADRFDPSRPAPAEPYSPRRRTALVLTGTGTAGAYHAGVLRALHEAGVKLDIVAGRGIGVVGALFAAVDGGQRLWDEAGFWRAPESRLVPEPLATRSEEHTSELQSHHDLVCRLLLEKKKKQTHRNTA